MLKTLSEAVEDGWTRSTFLVAEDQQGGRSAWITDQASHDSGNVPFKKTKNMPIMLAVLLW